jgi:glycosyltransferase involved in cell wall biosynthesis
MTSIAMDSGQSERPTVVIVCAVPATLTAFLAPHIHEMRKHFTVTVICSGEFSDVQSVLPEGVSFLSVKIERKIDIKSDLRALWRLYSVLRRQQPDCVHSVTPKAGLLAMIAGCAARVPIRIHTFTGQVWATRSGVIRALFRLLDKLIASLATHLLVDSNSQKQFLVEQRVSTVKKLAVLGEGSICGVNLARFRPDPQVRIATRAEFAIPLEAKIVLFVGRMNRDKGLCDLAAAFRNIAPRFPDAFLVVVGPDEDGEKDRATQILAGCADHVRFVGFSKIPEEFMAASDIFAMPSYREGFGSVVIEAAACGLPCIASRIYGLTDAVVDGITGVFHEPGDVSGIEGALARLLTDHAYRGELGEKALRRAESEFSQERIVGEQLKFVKAALITLSQTGAA